MSIRLGTILVASILLALTAIWAANTFKLPQSAIWLLLAAAAVIAIALGRFAERKFAPRNSN
jgi:cobalamin synthase